MVGWLSSQSDRAHQLHAPCSVVDTGDWQADQCAALLTVNGRAYEQPVATTSGPRAEELSEAPATALRGPALQGRPDAVAIDRYRRRDTHR